MLEVFGLFFTSVSLVWQRTENFCHVVFVSCGHNFLIFEGEAVIYVCVFKEACASQKKEIVFVIVVMNI